MLTVTINLVDTSTGWHGSRLLGLEIQREGRSSNYTVRDTDGRRWRVEGFDRRRKAAQLVKEALMAMPEETQGG